MKSLLLLVICLSSINIFSQKYIPFKDQASLLWGIKNAETGEITLKGKFTKFEDYNDTIFLIKNDDNSIYGINQFGHIILPPSKCPTQINKKNNSLCGQIMELPIHDNHGNTSNRYYIVNLDRQCLPNDYYPCPHWKPMRKINLPEYMSIIQEGERARYEGNIDSAVYYCKKAINVAPNNSFVYFWGANLFIENWQDDITSKNNNEYLRYYNWIDSCLVTAFKTEHDIGYRYLILRAMRKFYKNSLKDKEKLKQIESEYNIAKKRIIEYDCTKDDL